MGWLQFTPSQYYLLTIQDGRTGLMLAAMGGHTLIVKALIGGGADPHIQDSVSRSDCSVAWLCSNMCYSFSITASNVMSSSLYFMQYFI